MNPDPTLREFSIRDKTPLTEFVLRHGANRPIAKTSRGWFTYSLRSLLVLMLAAGTLCGWLSNTWDKYRREQQALAALADTCDRSYGGFRNAREDTTFDCGTGIHAEVRYAWRGPAFLKPLAEQPGFHIFNRVTSVYLYGPWFDDAVVDDLCSFEHLEELCIGDSNIRDVERLERELSMCEIVPPRYSFGRYEWEIYKGMKRAKGRRRTW